MRCSINYVDEGGQCVLQAVDGISVHPTNTVDEFDFKQTS